MIAEREEYTQRRNNIQSDEIIGNIAETYRESEIWDGNQYIDWGEFHRQDISAKTTKLEKYMNIVEERRENIQKMNSSNSQILEIGRI